MAAKIEIVPQAALPSVRKSARWKPRIIDRWAGRGVAMAGVSIIVGAMTESEDFAALFAAHEAQAALEMGQVVKGRVIQITAEHVFVDVGGKGEAWIDRAELADDEGKLKVAIGDEVEATVVSTGEEIRLSHKLRQGAQARDARWRGGPRAACRGTARSPPSSRAATR